MTASSVDFEELSKSFGYSFQNKDLVRSALTHSSLGKDNYERLEFLGDSVVNLAAASLLFHRFPDLREGDLSRLRASLVKKSALTEMANNINLEQHVRLAQIRNRSGRGVVQPSILSDVFEALLGVVFLEAGFEKSSEVATALLAILLDKLDPKSSKDPKTKLQEFLQAQRVDLPEYVILNTYGLAHQQIFEVACRVPALDVEGIGHGRSRRLAEQEAAAIVLTCLDYHGTEL
ncbi:ribonuclease III [Candidatus Ichthyocystis hellenicum]|uniref:ribonuclease III n=1 Tax=Candidatus Ichthyocystis hellenicum TaxID=1561003 RepID=UPI000A9F0EF6|nr:ribonuclease III [Candidatus Ichthyocystis hellenicum]